MIMIRTTPSSGTRLFDPFTLSAPRYSAYPLSPRPLDALVSAAVTLSRVCMRALALVAAVPLFVIFVLVGIVLNQLGPKEY